MRKKIQSNQGFTLSEVLMTVLILGLVTSVIAGGVMVVRNVYQNVTLKAEAQTLRSTTITAITDELRYAQDIIQTETAEGVTGVEFDSVSRGYRIALKAEKNQDIQIYSMVNDTSVPLLTSKTNTDKLQPRIEAFAYDSDKGTFSMNVVIYYNDKPFAGHSDNQKIIIRPINKQDS